MSNPPSKPGLSLYANLLQDAETSTSKSNPPPTDTAAKIAAKKQSVDAALLRFQPIRRVIPQKQKPKTTFPKSITATFTPAPSAQQSTASAPAAPVVPAAKPSLADFAPTEEDEWLYGTGEKRQRGGRKKKNKRWEERQEGTDWDGVYDPSRPTNVDEYLNSEERQAEIWEWKDLLYQHRKGDETDDDGRMHDSDEEYKSKPAVGVRIPPPAGLSFAPPPPASPPRSSAPIPPAPEAIAIISTASGDDAYARRLALSQQPAASPGVLASSAPIRYTQPDPKPMDTQESDDDWDDRPTLGLGASETTESPTPTPSSNRSGQAGFANRMMAKYGWTKGSGLGASGDGITSALAVKVEKRKKRSDAEGGGCAEPAGVAAKVVGGKRKGGGGKGKFGVMGEVVVLKGMLEGMEDLNGEVEAGLGQEIGEECGEKYGRVERLYIDQENRQVFIKFTDQISALRAVSELDGRIFNGNIIRPAYYDAEKFEAGIYI